MYDPGLCSFNRGDEIISNAVYDGLSEFLADKYVTSISSHMASIRCMSVISWITTTSSYAEAIFLWVR